jgi:hypothetical protein
MTKFQRGFHSLLLSIAFTLITWMIIDTFIINVSFGKYIILEIAILISEKLYLFTLSKTNLR